MERGGKVRVGGVGRGREGRGGRREERGGRGGEERMRERTCADMYIQVAVD